MTTKQRIERVASEHGWTVHSYTGELFAQRGDRRIVVLFTRAGAVSSFLVNGRGFSNKRNTGKREMVLAELAR